LNSLIQHIADETVEKLLGSEEIELMRDFATPFPLRVITQLLGVPAEDLHLVEGWTRRVGTLLDPISGEATMKEINRAFDQMDTYFQGLFEDRRQRPRDDILSALLTAREEGEQLSELEVLSLVALLLEAGHVTTAGFIGSAAVALLEQPDTYWMLREDSSLLETAVEEILRFDSPVQATLRVLSEDIETGGARMRKSEQVLCLLGSANHDEEIFIESEKLDIGRRINPHLAFGYGTHFCLGAQLARCEARVALKVLLELMPQLRQSEYDLKWKPSLFLRGPQELRFRF
jgi:cytochrome P450